VIGHFGVICPLIGTIESFNECFWKQTLEVAHQDDVIFAVEVNPAAVALLGVSALSERTIMTVEDFVQ
jgi:hypothetical protein